MANCWSWSLRGVIPASRRIPEKRRGSGIVLCVWPSKKVILQGGKKGENGTVCGPIFGGWTLKMFIVMTKTGEILECPWSGQQSFRKTACLSHQHTPPIMIRLMWKGPSIITNRQRSSISTATHQLMDWNASSPVESGWVPTVSRILLF